MSFICPDCSEPTLTIIEALELGSDNSSDERSLQLIACQTCGFRGVALYEESRRGSFGSEHVRHQGFKADPESLERVKKLISSEDTRGADELLPPLVKCFSSFEMELVR